MNECVSEINTGEFSKEYFPKENGLTFVIRNTNEQIIKDENYFVDRNEFTKFTKKGDILTARVGAIGNFGVVNQDFENCVY